MWIFKAADYNKLRYRYIQLLSTFQVKVSGANLIISYAHLVK